jgi:hypothetical protein
MFGLSFLNLSSCERLLEFSISSLNATLESVVVERNGHSCEQRSNKPTENSGDDNASNINYGSHFFLLDRVHYTPCIFCDFPIYLVTQQAQFAA